MSTFAPACLGDCELQIELTQRRRSASTTHLASFRSKTPQVGSNRMKHKTFIGASLLAAIAASLCCILPIVFALGGFAIVGASAFFESLRPYFLIATFALLGVGFYLAYRKPNHACEPGFACARPEVNRFGRIGLWMATVLVIAVAAFPCCSC